MTPSRLLRIALFAAILCCLAPLAASAQDVVTVGTVTASGNTVDVPVSIRDVSGTPLGMDQPAANRIQAYSIKVDFDATKISSATFSRAGITAHLTPVFESTPSSSGSVSLLDSFDGTTNPIPFTLNAPPPGDQVAHIVFTLSANATPGTSIALSLDSSVTDLTNQGGTTTEKTSNGNLSLNNGVINVPPLTVSLSPTFANIDQGGSTTMTANLNVSTGTTTTVNLSSSNSAVASVPASIDIPAGSTSGTLTVTAGNIGSATITASLSNGSSANASVNVNGPSLTLAPLSQSVTIGGTAPITASISAAQASNTTVTLTSGDPSVVTVPASVVIPAGQTSATFNATGVAIGAVSIQAQLPQSLGGAGAQALVRVTTDCITPVAPQISGPADSPAGVAYSITWPAVSGATEYLVDEATDPGFGNATTKSVTTTSATFTHSGSADVRYYYRVRAHNHAGNCDLTSPSSNTVSVLVHASVVPPTRVLPVVGSLPGANGSFFKTGVQLYNPKSVTITGKIVFHPAAVAGTASDPSTTYSLAPGKTQAFADLLPSFSQSGIGTADVIADLGSSFPVTVTRIFNDAGALGTSGMTEELLKTDDALQSGDTGVLLAPSDVSKFRLNVGIRTLTNGATITITVRDKDNVVLKTIGGRSYPATYFLQTGSADFLGGLVLTGNESISIHLDAGSAFVYGAITDNITNDPSLELARRVE